MWNIVLDEPNVPIKLGMEGNKIPNEKGEFNNTDHRLIEKNAKAKKILIYDLGPDEYSRVSACTNAKMI